MRHKLFRGVLVSVLAAVSFAVVGAAGASAQTLYAVTPITDQAGIDEASINATGQAALTVWWGSCCDTAEYWSNGVIRQVPVPASCDGCDSIGSGSSSINGTGQIAGSMSSSDPSGGDIWQAFRYSIPTNQTTLISTLGGRFAFGEGINGAGQVVGESDTSSGETHAFLWDGSSVKDLGTLGGQDSVAFATYASGQAVGCAQTSTGAYHPFLYQGGAIRDLGLPSGMTQGCAISVNSAGTILGWANDGASGCATWIWQSGTRTILPTVNAQCIVSTTIPDTGYLDGWHGHIANTGQVVGGVTNSTGTSLPVVYQNGTASIITGPQTPFDPQSAAGDITAGWFGVASGNNLHGLISVLGPNNSSNTLFLLTPVTIKDDAATAITYSSGWSRVALAGAYGGYVKQCSTAGKTATIRFTGKSVSVIGGTGVGLGSASVSVDGASKGTLSEAGTSKTRVRLDTIYFPSRGTHTLKLTVTSGLFKLDAITVAAY